MQRGGQADPVGAFEGDRHGDHRDDLQAEAGRLAVSLGGEDGGSGPGLGEHAARFGGGGLLGVLHGTRTLVLQDEEGQIHPTHSVSAGLDYPAVGPMHVALHDTGRTEYTRVDDEAALAGFHLLAEKEGILPALETAHAVAEVMRRAPDMGEDEIILVNLSGRGDKDLASVLEFDGRPRGIQADALDADKVESLAEHRFGRDGRVREAGGRGETA